MKFLINLIEYGLYLLVFLLPIQTRLIIKAGELNGSYWEYGTISLYAADIFLIVLFFLFIFLRMKESKISNFQFPISNYWYIIGGLEFFVFISIFFAPDKIVALFSYARFLLSVGFFWLIVKAPYNKIKLILSFLAGIFLQACLGIWQFFSQSTFASKWLGMALHNANELGTSVVETVGADGVGERWLRAYGGLDHPNMLGGLLAVGVLLIVYLFFYLGPHPNPPLETRGGEDNEGPRPNPPLETRGGEDNEGPHPNPPLETRGGEDNEGPRPNPPLETREGYENGNLPPPPSLPLGQREELFLHPNLLQFGGQTPLEYADKLKGNKKISFLYRFRTGMLYSLLLTFISALFFTFSRGAWAGLISGLVVILFFLVIKKNFKAQRTMLEVILFSGLIVFVLFSMYSNLVLTRLSQNTRLEIKSNTERVESYKIALDIIKKNWLFGVGIGNYTLAYRNLEVAKRESGEKHFSRMPAYFYQPVHDVFLLVWAETGIFGLLFFILLLMYTIILNLKFKILSEEQNLKINKFINYFKIKNLKLKISTRFKPGMNFNLFNISLLITLFIVFLVDHWLFSLHFGVLFFWLVMGLIFRQEEESHYQNSRH